MVGSESYVRYSKDEHKAAVLESVMVFCLAAGAVAEVVVPLGLAKAGFLSGCTVVFGHRCCDRGAFRGRVYTVLCQPLRKPYCTVPVNT